MAVIFSISVMTRAQTTKFRQGPQHDTSGSQLIKVHTVTTLTIEEFVVGVLLTHRSASLRFVRLDDPWKCKSVQKSAELQWLILDVDSRSTAFSKIAPDPLSDNWEHNSKKLMMSVVY